MKMNKEKWITALSITLIVVCVVLIYAGYFNGEADVVLTKARNICMECIGIG